MHSIPEFSGSIFSRNDHELGRFGVNSTSVSKKSGSLVLYLLITNQYVMFLTILFSCSLILWIFDRFSPYSYQNNRDKYADDDEQRLFDLKESLWFCMTSLTPQGGGEAPKSKRKRHVLQRQVNSNMNNL